MTARSPSSEVGYCVLASDALLLQTAIDLLRTFTFTFLLKSTDSVLDSVAIRSCHLISVNFYMVIIFLVDMHTSIDIELCW